MKDTGERLIPKLHQKSIAYGEHLARYQSAALLVANKVVLDIACGTGYGSQLLAHTAKAVIGMDVSAEAVEYAKQNYPKDNVSYQVGDANAIPLDDQSVDVVVSLETIEHLPHPELFVNEVKRILKPGGILVVSTPNDNEFTEGNIFHVHEFDFTELDRLMKKYFKHFEYYFQGSWYASGILTKQNFENKFSAAGLQATKSFEQAYKKAIYYIAVASDADLPELNQNVVVADVYSAKEAQAHAQAQVERTDALDKIIDDHRALLIAASKHSETLQAELNRIHNSKGWRMLQPMYKLKRKIKR